MTHDFVPVQFDPTLPFFSAVYYAELDGLIKIGTTRQLAERMRQLRANLLAWEQGSTGHECRRHRQFAEYRIHGEWFAPGLHLLAHIIGLRRCAVPTPWLRMTAKAQRGERAGRAMRAAS